MMTDYKHIDEMTIMDDVVVYTITEVSKLLKTNRNFVYNLIHSGQLKAVRIGSLKVRKKDLYKYIDGLN
ncbi:MAG: helix-turn-helix domain-containing protein [Oscillospiraceae bacterium]|nr:helix-turn-helix domain-containing protein [Oscillospiraceae bacterium]